MAITGFIGYLNMFNLIWLFSGLALIAVTVFRKRIYKILKHKIIRILFLVIAFIFSLSFILIEINVINNAKTNQVENADYIILLGAGLNGKNPSLTLTRRINTAIDYLKLNQNTKIIVSGGRGRDEDISEAEVISNVLQNNGISAEHIVLEDKSRNTLENLKYSGEIINDYNKKVLIVSSEFHLFRAKSIAKKIGYKNIYTLASKSPRILLVNYYVREYFAVIKEIIVKNI
ncbi:MAG: YdcF family protein [Treponema sp.]|jgi:uncharacterized SAM-binding protein YcdF (DUF218 family)|nr:YdcF family protein [Treponema sp.]